MENQNIIKIIVSCVALVCFVALVIFGVYKGSSSSQAVSTRIDVVSREDGSGTRGAFVDLLKIVDDDGNDITTKKAEITNSTGVMISTVAGNECSIGYISLGSMNDSVKALKVDGVEPTVENVKNGSYKVTRSFNIVVNDNLSDVAQDFIDYIFSNQGQKIIEANDYISVESSGNFAGGNVAGDLKISGSSSVAPLMEKLAEGYNQLNSNVKIDVLQSDSSTGIQDTLDGINDFGMASRELKDNEIGVSTIPIAKDGIVVIVNNANSTEGVTSQQIKKIFTGEITDWLGIE